MLILNTSATRSTSSNAVIGNRTVVSRSGVLQASEPEKRRSLKEVLKNDVDTRFMTVAAGFHHSLAITGTSIFAPKTLLTHNCRREWQGIFVGIRRARPARSRREKTSHETPTDRCFEGRHIQTSVRERVSQPRTVKYAFTR